MKTVGIIAEYNPFHKGHAHQIAFLKKQGIDTIVVALSGYFVQRGVPAWTDKYLRTRMALEQGIDFVFELPALYALSSAEGFAFGGVSLLNALPLDGLCFGSECGDLKPLQAIADFLYRNDQVTNAEDAALFRQHLQKSLKSGLSFPAAREQALHMFFDSLLEQYPDLLSGSNNVLSIEYLKALKKLNSPLQPVTLSRKDAGYHSTTLEHHSGNASASAIREAYRTSTSLESLRPFLPEAVYELLQEHPRHYPLSLDDLSSSIYLCLRKASSPEDYTAYGEISPDLAQRLWNFLPEYTTVTDYIEKVKTKNITYSRISRSLIHLLLGITGQQTKQAHMQVPYLRLLGMRREKSSFLRQIKSLPVITKVADYPSIFADFYNSQDDLSQEEKHSRQNDALDCFQTDLLAADIYRQTLFHKTGIRLPDEYHAGVVIL